MLKTFFVHFILVIISMTYCFSKVLYLFFIFRKLPAVVEGNSRLSWTHFRYKCVTYWQNFIYFTLPSYSYYVLILYNKIGDSIIAFVSYFMNLILPSRTTLLMWFCNPILLSNPFACCSSIDLLFLLLHTTQWSDVLIYYIFMELFDIISCQLFTSLNFIDLYYCFQPRIDSILIDSYSFNNFPLLWRFYTKQNKSEMS